MGSRTVALAIPLPLGGFALATFALVATLSPNGFFVALKEAGIGGPGVISLGLCAATAAGVALALGAPRAVALGAGAVPWLLGGVFALQGATAVASALSSVSAVDRATLLAAGASEIAALALLGPTLSAGIFVGTSAGFLLRAANAEERAAACAGGALALLLAGLALADALAAIPVRVGGAAFASVGATDRMTLLAHAASYRTLALGGYVVAALGAGALLTTIAWRARESAPLALAPALLCVLCVLPFRAVDRRLLDAAPPPPSRTMAERFAGVAMLESTDGRDDDDGTVPDYVIARGGVRDGAGRVVTFAAAVDAEERGARRFLVAKDATRDDLRAFADALVAPAPAPPPAQLGVPLLDALAAASAGFKTIRLQGCSDVPKLLFVPSTGARRIVDDGPFSLLPVDGGDPIEAPASSLLGYSAGGDAVPRRCVYTDAAPSPEALWRTLAVLARDDAHEAPLALLGTRPPEPSQPKIFGRAGLGGSAQGVLGMLSGVPSQPHGFLDREVIQRVVRQHVARVQYCYERALTKNPNLGGKITLRWTITMTGAVSAAAVTGSDMDDAQMQSCIVNVISSMQFPAPRGGVVEVSYPFVFKAAE
jgi:hypothetical protein